MSVADDIANAAANNQISAGPGGSIASAAEAYANSHPGATMDQALAAAQGGGGGGVSSGGGSSGGGGGGGGTGTNLNAAQLLLNQAQQAAYQAYLNSRLALDTDQEAYQKAAQAAQTVMQQAALTGVYNGQPTLAAQNQAQQNAMQLAQLTGVYTPPSLGGSSGAGAGPAALQSYSPGTVVRSSSSGDFGVIGPNGTITTGPSVADQIAQAAQTPGAILTVSDTDFSGGTAAASAAANAGTGTTAAGTPTLAAQLQQANLTGTYNGAPTESAREFNTTTGLNYLDLLGKLQGPANYGSYLRVLGSTPGGISDLVNAASGQYVPSTGATTGAPLSPQTLGTLANPNGGKAMAGGSEPNSPQGTDPTYQQYMQAANALPAPNQISPDSWNAFTTSQKQMLLGMYGQSGYDVNDVADLYKQSLPKYSGPAGAGTVKLA